MSLDPTNIACWQRLDAGTTTSGRLVADDVAQLAAIGVRHVINLALADSPGALPDEADLLAGRGIGYTHIPVPFDAPGEDHFAAFADAFGSAPRPVHVHCIMNWRVSAFFYRYNRTLRGMPKADAETLMAQQWHPYTSLHADSPAWAAFISAGDDAP